LALAQALQGDAWQELLNDVRTNKPFPDNHLDLWVCERLPHLCIDVLHGCHVIGMLMMMVASQSFAG
jgi:hypothetical protein